jgi:hypothetical protein
MVDYKEKPDFRTSKIFSKDDSCVWIVYPSGGAGDLLATIINYHYLETGSSYRGINDNGQVIISPSDGKITNIKYRPNGELMCNEELIHDINYEIGKNNLSYNILDMVLLANHCFKDQDVEKILSFFKKAKIIRILPKSKKEAEIIYWLSQFKNYSKRLSIDSDTIKQFEFEKFKTNMQNERVFEIEFHELFNKKKFEDVYTRLIKYLNLPYKLIRFDLIEFWLKKQDQQIRTQLELL